MVDIALLRLSPPCLANCHPNRHALARAPHSPCREAPERHRRKLDPETIYISVYFAHIHTAYVYRYIYIQIVYYI